MDANRTGRGSPARLIALFLSSLVVSACSQNKNSFTSGSLNWQSCQAKAKSNSFLVKWKGSVPPQFARNKLSPNSLVTRFQGVEKSWVQRFILDPHSDEYQIAEYEYTLNVEPTDTSSSSTLPQAWGPADISASDAWTYLGKKGDNIVVAVIDTGVDLNHPLLQSQIWHNTKEIPHNGIDDDNDGLIDDYDGYDFNANLPEPTDGKGHGTHCAGVIAGQAGINNFTGIAPNAKIMALKFLDDTGSGNVGDAITAMEYAVAHGAKVISASWGGDVCSDVLKAQISEAVAAGTVFVNAAGNSGKDLNVAPEWPAAFQIPGKITIASYNSSQFLSYFSNFGALVDLAAPGETILSTYPPTSGQPEGQMASLSGTSMATPFVAGVAALLMSAKPTASPLDIVNAINSSVIKGRFGVRTQGKVNALGAAQYLMTH